MCKRTQVRLLDVRQRPSGGHRVRRNSQTGKWGPQIHLKSTLSQEESQGCLGSREEVLGKKLQLRFFIPLTLWLLVSVPTVF